MSCHTHNFIANINGFNFAHVWLFSGIKALSALLMEQNEVGTERLTELFRLITAL